MRSKPLTVAPPSSESSPKPHRGLSATAGVLALLCAVTGCAATAPLTLSTSVPGDQEELWADGTPLTEEHITASPWSVTDSSAGACAAPKGTRLQRSLVRWCRCEPVGWPTHWSIRESPAGTGAVPRRFLDKGCRSSSFRGVPRASSRSSLPEGWRPSSGMRTVQAALSGTTSFLWPSRSGFTSRESTSTTRPCCWKNTSTRTSIEVHREAPGTKHGVSTSRPG